MILKFNIVKFNNYLKNKTSLIIMKFKNLKINIDDKT
jgi:hypothetical protein